MKFAWTREYLGQELRVLPLKMIILFGLSRNAVFNRINLTQKIMNLNENFILACLSIKTAIEW